MRDHRIEYQRHDREVNAPFAERAAIKDQHCRRNARGASRRPSDVNGVYGAAGAGVAVGPGAGGIVLANQNGTVLTLSGRQMGLIVAADLNGLVISLR